MDEVLRDLSFRGIRLVSEQFKSGNKVVVGIVGAPGSGKTTAAELVALLINGFEERELAVVVPMDGFHFYRKQLDAMPNPTEAHARRGAAFTFDADRFVAAVKQLKEQTTAEISLPSFDHAQGDPVEDAIKVTNMHRIVLVEGNYLLLDQEPWRQLRGVFNETWFLDVDIDVAMERVFQRQTEIGLTAEESRKRIAENDRPNAEQIVAASRGAATLLVPSLPFAEALQGAAD